MTLHDFNYRAPRFATEIAVELRLEQVILHGRCIRISLTGMEVELSYPAITGQTGLLVLRSMTGQFQIGIRVTHGEGLKAGFEFIFGSSQERQIVQEIVNRFQPQR